MKKLLTYLIAVMMFVSLASCRDLPVENKPVPAEPPTPPVAGPVPTAAPAAAESPASEPVPTAADPVLTPPPAPVHVHDWQPVKEVIHHEAVTKQVKVVDVPATEGHFEGSSYEVMICRCGEEFTSYDSWLTHAHAGGSEEHGGFTTDVRSNQVWVEGTPEVSHYETRVVSEAWDEELVTGEVCTSCGAVR